MQGEHTKRERKRKTVQNISSSNCERTAISREKCEVGVRVWSCMELMELYNNNLVDIPVPEHTMHRMEWETVRAATVTIWTIPRLCIAYASRMLSGHNGTLVLCKGIYSCAMEVVLYGHTTTLLEPRGTCRIIMEHTDTETYTNSLYIKLCFCIIYYY